MTMFPRLLPLFLLLSPLHAQNPHTPGRAQPPPASAFSINSPRQEDGRNAAESPEDPVLVRLPDDLEAVINLQKSDRSRIHASILGLPPEGDQFSRILGGGDGDRREVGGQGSDEGRRKSQEGRQREKERESAKAVTTQKTPRRSTFQATEEGESNRPVS